MVKTWCEILLVRFLGPVVVGLATEVLQKSHAGFGPMRSPSRKSTIFEAAVRLLLWTFDFLLSTGSSLGLRGSSRAVNRRAQTVCAEGSQHNAVDEDRRRASDTVHLTVADIMLDLCRVNAPVKLAVKLRSIKTKLTCILLQRGHVECFLPLK